MIATILKLRFSFLLIILLLNPVYSQERVSILFIFDASGSMAEEINSRAKIDLAKEFVYDFLQHGLNANYGLTIVGTETGGGNTNFYTPVKTGPDKELAIIEELKRVVPAGKSPIASAIIDGSRYFEAGNKNYVILITDGIENMLGGPVRVTDTLRKRGIISRVYVVGFEEKAEDNPMIADLIRIGNGLYSEIGDTRNLLSEFQGLTTLQSEIKTTGLLGYRCFIVEENGFPAYGSKLVLRDSRGRIIGEKSFWRGIFEDIQPGRYTLTASNGSSTQQKSIDVNANSLNEINFIFNVRTGSLRYQNFIQGTNNSRAYGSITKVFHETGETVYTGTSWGGVVDNIPEGQYTIEGYVEGLPRQTQTVDIITGGEEPLVEFWFNVGKGRISFKCYMDSTRNKVANGTIVKILRLPYLENVLEMAQWRGITQYLPYGNYLTEGNFKGIIRIEQLEVKPDSTTEIEFIFNIRQVRLSYQCFRSQAKAPASGVEVQIINSMGRVVENLNRWRGSFNLPEGIYTLQAKFQGQTIKRTIHLYASETTAMQENIYFDKKE